MIVLVLVVITVVIIRMKEGSWREGGKPRVDVVYSQE